jgi:hypothetical protein
MTSVDSNFKIRSPFLEGIAKCFDFAGFFNDCTLPPAQNTDPIAQDWLVICSDYNNSFKIINEELHGDKKIKAG